MKQVKFVNMLGVLLMVVIILGMSPLMVSAASLRITAQPKTSYTSYGSNAKATIKAQGDGLKYTWYYKNAGTTKYTKSSITKSTYTTTMNDKANGRSVYCVVKDKKGKTVKSKTVVLRMKATITTEPKNIYVKQNEKAKTDIKAKGDGLKYTWYYKNSGATKYTKSSITKSTYSVTMTDKIHGRSVYCVVKDKYGKIDKSKTVVLRQAATILTQPKNVTVDSGKSAKVTVKAVGDGLEYTWYYKNASASKYTKSTITKPTYSITMTDKIHGRTVYCVVTDKYGKTDKSNTVILKQKSVPMNITMQPESVSANVGDEAGFGIVVTGGTKPYTYEWKYICDGMEEWMVADGEVLTLGSQNMLSVIVNESTFKNRYCCIVTDADGNKVQSNEVWVEKMLMPLSIDRQPQCVTADVGEEASFGLIMTGGEEPYTYQWQYTYEGTSYWLNCKENWAAGANTDTMTFVVEQTDFDYNYTYRCVITDATGETVYSDEVYVVQR